MERLMRVQTPRWKALVGLLLVMASVAGMVWLVPWAVGEVFAASVSARTLFLFCSALIVLVLLLSLGAGGVLLIAEGGTSFVLGPDGVTRQGWLGKRLVRWSDVVDWELPPGVFERAPRQLVLIGRDGARLVVPLNLKPHEEWRRQLMAGFPPLAAHGLDRVRFLERGEPPSVWRVRLMRDKGLGFGLGGIFIVLAMGALTWSSVERLLDQRRLNRHGIAIQAHVVEVVKDDDRTRALVRFRPAVGGDEVRVRRPVKWQFIDHFKPGDPVTVEYLPERPSLARIRGWDVAGRLQWVILLFSFPFAWMGLLLIQWGIITGWRPLHAVVWWSATPQENGFSFGASGVSLEPLCAAFPERHQGAIVFARVEDVTDKEQSNLPALPNRLRKAGLAAREVAGMFVVLAGADARRLVGRLGRSEVLLADYVVLDAEAAEDAEAHAVTRLVRDGHLVEAEELRDCRFFSWRGTVGPFTRAEMTEAFDRWMRLQLHELYRHVPPEELAHVKLSEVFGVDGLDGAYQVMFERFRWGVRAWLRRDWAPDARVAEFHHGRWIARPTRPVPRAMSRSGLFWYLFFLGPVLLLLLPIYGAVQLLFLPFTRWNRKREERDRQRSLQAVREGIAHQTRARGGAQVEES